MKLHSHMTLWRDDEKLRVQISGTYEPADECGPEKVVNIFAQDYDSEIALTESERNEAEQILITQHHENTNKNTD